MIITKDEKCTLAESTDTSNDIENPPPYSPAAPQVVITPAKSVKEEKKAKTGSSSSSSPINAPNGSKAPSSGFVDLGSTKTYGNRQNVEREPPHIPCPSAPHILRASHQHARYANAVPMYQQFVIDPYLPLYPEALIEDGELDENYGPILGGDNSEGGEEIRNLKLEGKNTNIDAEVWIVNDGRDEAEDTLRKAYVDVRTKNGNVSVKLHADSFFTPFVLRVGAGNGNVHVALPRSFSGPLTARTRNGWTSFSSSLAPCVATFSDVLGTKKCFVGDLAESGFGRGEWTGSSVDITCYNGRIKICYYDETAVNKGFNRNAIGSSAFFDRMFGMA